MSGSRFLALALIPRLSALSPIPFLGVLSPGLGDTFSFVCPSLLSLGVDNAQKRAVGPGKTKGLKPGVPAIWLGQLLFPLRRFRGYWGIVHGRPPFEIPAFEPPLLEGSIRSARRALKDCH